MGNKDDEIVREFLIESQENLDQVDQDLVDLERSPGSAELVDRVFRAVHTVKGTCGFFGFSHLEAVAHAGENLLARMREGRLATSPEIISALLATMDALRTILASIERQGSEGHEDYADLIARLVRLSSGNHEEGVIRTRLFDRMIVEGRLTEHQVEAAAERQRQGDPRRLGEILVEQGALTPNEVLDVLLTHGGAHRPGSEDHVRVDLRLLDRLMDLVGELVLARNQMLQLVEARSWTALPTVTQRVHQVTSRLQEEVMGTRMQAMHTLWNKLPRLVRDLSTACDKRVRLALEGGDTELDKSLVDAIRDPLTHLVRNAVDHGIETPAEREAAGKPAEGLLSLRAAHEGGQVVIEVTDDGRGMSVARIREKAVERGLVPRTGADHLTDRDWLNLIFLPGFSTAASVTHVSGRGVGMDVVRANVERIGGTIEVRSEEGSGTTVCMRVPLTLAIIPALVVTDGVQPFAVPQANLREMVRLRGSAVRNEIADFQGAPVLRLRQGLIPLVDLRVLLGAPPAPFSDPTEILILESGGRTVGLVIGGVHDTQEIVVKPLTAEGKGQGPFAGATVLGDGATCLILDVSWILAHAGGGAGTRDTGAAPAAEGSSRRPLLVVRAGAAGYFAIPLEQVTRLEKFPAAAVENLRGTRIVQYRGQGMRIWEVDELLPAVTRNATPARAQWPVVVHAGPGGPVGLAVDEILDVEQAGHLQASIDGAAGVPGATVLRGRTTELLDLGALLGGRDLPGREARP